MNVNKKQTGLLLIPAVAISSIIAGKKVFDKYKLRKKCKNKEISKKEKEELNNFLELTMNISNFIKEQYHKYIDSHTCQILAASFNTYSTKLS